MKIRFIYLLLFIVYGLQCFSQKQSAILPVELTCEYLENPTGLDVAGPRFNWKLKTLDSLAFGQRQTAYKILVGSSIKHLQQGRSDIWNSGWVTFDAMQLIPYKGKSLLDDTDYYWKVCVKDEKGLVSDFSRVAHFSTGLINENNRTAKWIGTHEVYNPEEGDNKMYDPWFRKSFHLQKAPGRAVMFIASVGYHEVYVNGQKIGNHVLAPAVTDHSKRARYIAYDIGPALHKGENVIAIWLGVSWSIFAAYDVGKNARTPMVMAQADIRDKDNRKMVRIVTDKTWKTHPSPNKLTGNWSFRNFGGEIWDANKEIPNWNTTSLDDEAWDAATVYSPDLKLSAQQVETNTLFDEIHPVKIEKRNNYTFRIDMGVNFAGWTQIKVKGRPGDTIQFLFSERSQDAMTFGLKNLFVVGPTGEGVFHNRFNYSSGRWITITGLKIAPELTDVKGWMVRTNYKNATSFECSDSLQNWIYNTVRWTFENLSLGGYVVDCPQRERCGYGGDAHATTETGMLNYQLGALYTKWMQDWRDVQGTESMVGDMNNPSWARQQVGSGRQLGGGVLPHTAPTYWGGGGPAWGGIVVTLPWFVYQYQGDTRVLEDNFHLIHDWLGFLDSHTENNLLQRFGGQWDFLGDWLWPNATAQGMNNNSDETLFFNNCYRIYNLKTAAKIARVIGRTDDAGKWENQAAVSGRVLHQKYYHDDDHNYSDNSMRSLAAALYADIMPVEVRPLVLEQLAKEILVNQKGHIDVGITGGAMLFKVLRDEGRDDLIYSMTSQTNYPGWGFMRDNDATTIWEMWEKDLPGHSLLHSSFLYPGAWYIDGVAGIRKDEHFPGYRKFNLRIPKLSGQQLSFAKAEFNSPAGLIKSYWKKSDGSTIFIVTVPPNCSATVFFPDEPGKAIRVSNNNVKQTGVKDGYALFEISSGTYRFEN